jgi:gamma-glutamyltranspeptidase/glutathione hydrolase
MAVILSRSVRWMGAYALAGMLVLQPVIAMAQDEESAAAKPTNGGDLIGYNFIHHPVIGRGGMVVAQSGMAARVGAQILGQGGNAVDAAVATAMAEVMSLPRAGNLGGGGYMLFYDAATKKTTAIEYYSQAPLEVTPDYLNDADGKLDQTKVQSFKGVAVPGTVAGLYEAHKRFGKLPWAKLIQPAIEMAEKGIALSDDEANALNSVHDAFRKDPDGALKVYFKPDGSAYKPQELFRNPDLASTLKQIQKHGAAGFYEGPVARKLVDAMQAHGGIVSLKDLASYRPNVLEPVWSSYRGHRIAYMPPTSAASSVAEVMNILEGFPLASYPQGSARSLHLIAEALKIAAVDRRYSGGGPQWHTPAHGMASKEFAAQRARLISMDQSLDEKSLQALDPTPYESPDTTHFSVADKDGNVVSNTFTLTASFGADVVAPGTGFLLNNSLGNFDWNRVPRSLGNKIEPGKRAQSTISPVIVFDNDKPWLVTGSPGGGTIVGTIVQMLVNVIDYHLDVAEAAERPRIFQRGPATAMEVEDGLSADTTNLLEEKGHKIRPSDIIGSTQSIMLGKDGLLYGAADTRRPGAEAVPVH